MKIKYTLLLLIFISLFFILFNPFSGMKTTPTLDQELKKYIILEKLNEIKEFLNQNQYLGINKLNVVFSTFETVNEIVEMDMKNMPSILFKGFRGNHNEAIKKQAKVVASQLIAKYNYNDSSIHILKNNLSKLFKQHSLNNPEKKQLVQLFIAHEMFHQLQDLRFGIKKSIARIKSKNELLIFLSILEGQAQIFMKSYAKNNSIPNKLVKLIGYVEFNSATLPPYMISATKQSMNFPYQKGSHYLEQKYGDNIDGIWTEYENLPNSIYNIVHNTNTVSLQSEDLSWLLDIIEDSYLGCSVNKKTFGFFDLYLTFIGYGNKLSSKIIESIYQADIHSLTCDKSNLSSVSMIRRNTVIKTELNNDFIAITRENLNQTSKHYNFKVSNYHEKILFEPSGHIISYELTAKNGVKTSYKILRLFNDNYIIEWQDIGDHVNFDKIIARVRFNK